MITISKPQNLSVTNVTSRSITITWLAPNDGTVAVTNYSLYFTNGNNNNTYIKPLANVNTYTIPDLGK